jgi:multicomponent Na+:H+ antiporter subunit E
MHRAVAFIIMFGFWLLLSGKFDVFHLSLGAVSCLLVAVISSDLLFQDTKTSLLARLGEALRFVPYTAWLLWQIIVANFNVIALAVSPHPVRRTITPHIFTFRTRLKSDFARFVLANSITLTPGTVTIRITGDIFHVHAITVKSAGDLAEGDAVSEMERRVAWAFEGGNA